MTSPAATAPAGTVAPATGAQALAWIAAALALVYAVYGAAWIVLHANPIASLVLREAAVTDQSDATLEKWFELSIYGPILLLGLLGLLLFRQMPRVGRLGATTLLGLASGAIAVALLVGIAGAGGIAHPATAISPRVSPALFATGTLLMVLQVASEEVLFRGLALPVLARAGGVPFGVIVSSAGFTLVHAFGDWTSPISLLNILLAGAWFALLACRSGGLAAPIAAHFAYNWTEAMLFGAAPNPGLGAFGSILDVELSGKAIWGGSVEGFNASIVLTLILGLFVAALLRRPRPASKPARQEAVSAS